MKKRFRAGIAFALLALFGPGRAAAEPPSPVALLRSVEVARGQHESLKATIEIVEVSPPAETVECVVEMDGDRRRSEVFVSGASREIVVRHGDEFRGYRRKANEDLHLYDVDWATGVRGDLAFDPRTIGLSDFLTCDLTVSDCLWRNDEASLEVSGRERMRDVDVWKVTATRGRVVSDYWIEEPSFRVHRRTITTPGLRVEVDSEFDPTDPRWPFPRRVVAKREDSRSPQERVYAVKRFEAGAAVSGDRFTVASMGLPVGTPAVDYRISRVVGYWNGEAMVPHLVYTGERPDGRSAPGAWGGRLWLLFANAAVVLALVAGILWRYAGPLPQALPDLGTRGGCFPEDAASKPVAYWCVA